jgi:hypothetical protein
MIANWGRVAVIRYRANTPTFIMVTSEGTIMYRRLFASAVAIVLFASAAVAQRADLTISLNEPFFDALLDSVYQNYDPPEFSVGRLDVNGEIPDARMAELGSRYIREIGIPADHGPSDAAYCTDSVKILREMNGVRTAVRFREGKIFLPLAFSGTYNPPFLGCVEFAGVAETNIDLEFDPSSQRLIGRAHVINVNLNGTGGLGGAVIAKLIQGSIDKKLNPIEVFRLDKLSFTIPIQNTGNIRMKAVSAVPEISGGSLNVRITYEFVKG